MARIRVEFSNVKVCEVCAIRDDLSLFKQFLEIGETMALIGTSGVGKSTIINSLLGYDKQSTSFLVKKQRRVATRLLPQLCTMLLVFKHG